jgi:hypothetical protein
MVNRLRDLVIDRVALVGLGDDPDAQVLLWKARRRPEEEGDVENAENMEKENGMLRAIRELAERRERTEAVMHDIRQRADAQLDPTGAKTLTKAEAAVATLRSAVEAYMDRHPGRIGHETTSAMALNAIASTAEGRGMIAAVKAEGASADEVLRKAFGMPELEEEPEPEPTAAERRLEELAKARARTSARPWESELADLVRTDEGRAAIAEHGAEFVKRAAAFAS